MQPEVT